MKKCLKIFRKVFLRFTSQREKLIFNVIFINFLIKPFTFRKISVKRLFNDNCVMTVKRR